MSKFKAVIDLSGYQAAQLTPTAQSVHDAMLAEAATFDDPPITMPDFQNHITTYGQKLAARESGASADQLAYEVARHDLESDLGELGAYVNLVAKGDQAIVNSSGFPSYDTARTADPNPPAAPTDLRLRQNSLSGSFTARYHVERGRSINEIQTNAGDPGNEAGWKPAGLFSGGKATLNNVVPGTVLWVRVRTVGIRGVMGAWSDPAKIMVV